MDYTSTLEDRPYRHQHYKRSEQDEEADVFDGVGLAVRQYKPFAAVR